MTVRKPASDAPRTKDLSTGSVGRHVLRLSVPATTEMALSTAVGLLDAFWLGKAGGLALAATAMGTALRMVLISPMMGLSLGGMALVSRHIGAGEQEEADHAVAQTIVLALLFVTALALLGLSTMWILLGWMGAEGQLLQDSISYVTIILIGLPFMELLPSINGVIRGAGHPERTLRIQIVNVMMMMALEPLLILGLGPFPVLGVRGAAWASVLGSAAGVIAQFITLRRGTAGVTIHLRHFRPDLGMMRRILRVAMPAAGLRFSPNLANALLMRLVASFGPEVLAAYSLVSRLRRFVQGPGMAIGSAAGTMVGQNLGAGRPDRSERAGYLATIAAITYSVVALGGVNLAPVAALSFFGAQSDTLIIAVTSLRWALPAGTGLAWSTVLGTALGGAGDTVSPMLVNIGSLWLLQLPLCWILASVLQMGPVGIWIGLAVGYLAGGLAMNLRFRQGQWKTTRV